MKVTEKYRFRTAKCVVVGDTGVGKTSIINRFGYDVFCPSYRATNTVDFDVQKFNILEIPFSLQVKFL